MKIQNEHLIPAPVLDAIEKYNKAKEGSNERLALSQRLHAIKSVVDKTLGYNE